MTENEIQVLASTPPPATKVKAFYRIGAANAEITRLEGVLGLPASKKTLNIVRANERISQLAAMVASQTAPVAVETVLAPVAIEPAPQATTVAAPAAPANLDLNQAVALADKILGRQERETILLSIRGQSASNQDPEKLAALADAFASRGLSVPGLQSKILFGRQELRGARKVATEKAQAEINAFLASK